MKYYDYKKQEFITKNEDEFKVGERGEDLVDTSTFIPELNQIQALNGTAKTKKYYDFEDGKDDGLNLHLLRQDMDIAERNTLIKAFKNKAENLDKEIKSEILEKMSEIADSTDQNSTSNSSQNNNTENTGN